MNKKNKLNKIIEEKKANSLNKKLRYGLRKLSIGVVSCFLGYAIALTPNLSYANTETNSVVTSTQTEKTTKDESKTTQKENKDMLQGKTVPPVGQVDHSDLTTNKVTEKSTIQKASMVNPIEKTEDKVEKMNTQYTVTYGPGLAYVGNSTTVNISFKQNNKKVNVPTGTTFELAGNSANGATVDKTTGVISYTPDPQEFKNIEKEKNVTVNVKVTYKDQSTSTVSATITVRKEESAVPKINPVVEGQTKITGTGLKGANIEVEIERKVNDGETAGVTTVKEDGTWEVVVEKDSIKEGYKVRAIQTEENKSSTATYTIATAKQENEKDKQKPDAGNQNPQDNGQVTPQEKSETPTVNPVTEGDITISGTGKAGAKIHVTKVEGNSPQGLIMGENIEVNNDGKWTLNVPKGKDLKKGDVVLVVQQEEGKDISKQVSSVVAEKKANKPTEQTEAPILNKINEKSTTISGTGKAGAKIFLKKSNAKTPQGIDLAKNIEVDTQGNWTYTVKAGELQVGDTIFAYQKEENKLISYEAHEEVTKAEVKKPDQDNQDNKQNPDPNKKPQQDPPSQDEKEAREKEEAAKLTIKDAYAGDKTLKGTAAPGYKVSLIIELKNQPGTSINKDATVDEHGNWSANLVDELKEGDKVTVYQTKQFKNGEKTITVKAKQEKPQNPSEDKNKPNPPADDNKDKPNPPAKEDESRKEKTKDPTINPVKEGDKVISGTGVPGAKVSITRTEKDSATGIILAKDIVVDATGNWSVTIDDSKKFKEGDTIFAVQREDDKEYSDQTEVTVAKADKKSQQPENNKKPENNNQDNQEKELSKFPVANEIKAGDTKIIGQGVPDATIVVTKQGENGKELKATVGKDGKWSVDLKEAAKHGDEFIIKQQEKGKRDSIGILKFVPKKPQVKKPETNTPDENKPGNNKKPENNNQDNQQNKLSSFPLVNEIKAGDTKVTGKGVPGATIHVTKVSKNGDRDAASLSTVVGEDGKWSVDLKEAVKEGDEFIIQQQEKGKKDSPRISKVTQKSDKKQTPEKKPEGEKKPGDTKKPEDNKNPETKKPDVKKPEGDKKPEGEKKPGDNKKPGDTKKPEDNKKPEAKKPDVKKPEVEKKPGDNKKPGDTKKPEDNKKPEAKKPDVKKPEAEKKPEGEKKPGDNKKPEDNKNPETKKPDVKKPEGEKKPGDNKRPEDNKKPEAEKNPEGEKKPGDTKKPEVKKPDAKKPEAEKKPGAEKKPEGEKKPGDTKKPEDNKNPETKKPDVKNPEGEKKPGDTKKPEDDKKPEAKKPEGEKKPGDTKKPEDDKNPETKKPDVKKPEAEKKPEGEKKPGDTKKPEDNKKPEAEKKPEGDKKPGDNKKPENNKKPDKKGPEQKPEVKNPGKTTNPSNNRKQPEKTPDVKKPETKTPEMKRPEKNAKKPSTQNKKSMDGLSLHYEIKTVKKGAKIKVTPVFKDKSGKIIKMPQGVMFSLDKNSPKGVKIDPKTGELSVDTTGYKNGDKIVVTVVATIKGSTTKVYSLFAKDGKTTQPNEPTKTTEQDKVIKTKVEINIEKSEKNKTNKNNKKASNKKKLPKAGYENEIISLAIAGITTLGGAYITNKKKK